MGLCESYKTKVRPEWIDENGHMNVAYYVLAFDEATDEFYRYVNLAEYLPENASFFTLEMNVSYVKEVTEGHPLQVSTQLLSLDSKRIRYYHSMYHSDEGYLVATNECLAIHVDMNTRRAAPMANALYRRLQQINQQHAKFGVPENSDRRFRI